jgi:medium-chain acyl-[acyl-carrier-protein] hydrolase
MSKLTSSWVMRPFPQPHATKRLFCLPFAGGGASAYRQWVSALGPTIEVCTVQLPGRENRLLEPAYDDYKSLTVALRSALNPLLDKPYALYGHSMGALLAFELARSLEDSDGPTGGPERIFLAAHRAAHLPLQRSPMANLPQDALIAKLSEYGGFSNEILDSPELMELLIPAIRADLKLCDLYHFEKKNLLRCPINVIAGALDKQTSTESTYLWALHSSGQTKVHVIDGGHFFLHTHSAQVLEIVRTCMID